MPCLYPFRLFSLGLCRSASLAYLCDPLKNGVLSQPCDLSKGYYCLKRFDKDPPVGNASKVSKLILGKMPKVKTNSSAKKRFKVSATGKIMHQKSFKRHILTKKSKKRKRNMRIDGEVAKSHVDFVKRLLRLK